MSSNIKVRRVCEQCGVEFEARKTTTKTCSDNCAKKLYKAKQRITKIKSSNTQTIAIKSKPIEDLKAKEFLSIIEACRLLGVSRWTLWRNIKGNEIKAAKIGNRLLIKRSDIDELFSHHTKQ